jgi:osmotically-inducible protein OsmY
MKTTLFLLICGIGLAGCAQKNDTAQTTSPDSSNNMSSNAMPANSNSMSTSANNTSTTNDMTASATTQPDNTGINSRDRAPDAVTASIRRRIMDGNMSISAQNVKIICQDGKVTLRGPVNSQEEKDTIGRMANDVAGTDNVDNQLEINPNG